MVRRALIAHIHYSTPYGRRELEIDDGSADYAYLIAIMEEMREIWQSKMVDLRAIQAMQREDSSSESLPKAAPQSSPSGSTSAVSGAIARAKARLAERRK